MNKLVVPVLFFLAVVVYGRPDTSTDESDNIDIDEILANNRLVDSYINCVKTGQKCTPIGQRARVVVYGRPDTSTDESDNIDIDEILANNRLVDSYINCVKTGQKCTPIGQRARELLPDALKTKCSTCTNIQKERMQKALEWVIQNKPNNFLELENQFDPEHQYRKQNSDELKKRNIVLPPLK
ncbi:hypothetical protein RN001_001954 [Aquatica leii]|uniref:Uncharacterized protein n=1 Tax=Aquatica leii TaxID=1421715 RepID=A0AAN7PGQ8_9COLE|nr:hypothetical protein RN001_001954 [Aquatica leii]